MSTTHTAHAERYACKGGRPRTQDVSSVACTRYFYRRTRLRAFSASLAPFITLNITNPEIGEESQLLTLEVFSDMALSTLRDTIHREAGIPATAQHLYHNGHLVTDDSKTMEQLLILDGDMLALHVRDMRGNTGVPEPRRGLQQRRRPAGGNYQDPEVVRLQILGSPTSRQELQRQNPELAAALEDPERFARIVNNDIAREERQRFQRQELIRGLNDDPFDVEKQRQIEEMIRQERVMENLQNAMEHAPEVFGRVHLLYINVQINNRTVKAMVDSGAQATVMSPRCAEECGIMRLVDKRFNGVARGVGTANIIGRVHLYEIKLGNLFLPCSFTVMEGKSVDLLLGLDMLKRHQAVLDIARDRLIIQGSEFPFLSEAEVPKEEEEAATDEPTLPGPAGTTIGQRSGVVTAPTAQAQQPVAGPSAPPLAPIPAAAPQPAQASSGNPFSQDDINKLVALGFPTEAAVNALRATDGDVEMAAGLLFGA
ncbi:related to SNARE binding protein [Cephalotrichum gorgonifer]|uniref:DNA damage-inducible protein 1 n=1 Tax=Cephalotrichum gorgonifer TaxID=2041049 RepID=A0AAE8SYJ4_9PEZI|nr:related to SNARE binding protein [Cephalotrichum gorgonifer]